jgi:hypothetical protein
MGHTAGHSHGQFHTASYPWPAGGAAAEVMVAVVTTSKLRSILSGMAAMRSYPPHDSIAVATPGDTVQQGQHYMYAAE